MRVFKRSLYESVPNVSEILHWVEGALVLLYWMDTLGGAVCSVSDVDARLRQLSQWRCSAVTSRMTHH